MVKIIKGTEHPEEFQPKMIDKREEIAKQAERLWFKGDYPQVWLEIADMAISLIVADNQTVELLSDEDWEGVNKKAGEDVIDMAMGFAHGRITATELAERIVKRCSITAQAQASKMINQGWFKGK